MDANTPEQVLVTAVFTNATGVKLVLPLFESINIVEFGAYNGPGADNVAAAVLKLQGVDTTAAGGTFTDLCVITHTSALVQGSFQSRRCDVLVDKINNIAVGPGASGNTNGNISPSATKQFIAVQLNVTTAYTASVAPYFYIKFRKQGTTGTVVTGESNVVS